MVIPGRIPMTEAEITGIEKLLAREQGKQITLTRSEPGDKGPVQVEIDGKVWHVSESGKFAKQAD